MSSKLSFLSLFANGLNCLVELIINTHEQNKRKETINIQCVKITKDHQELLTVISNWCNARLTNMSIAGVDNKALASIIKQDARFLTSLSHSLAIQKEKEIEYDSWLFFNGNVKETNYFELEQCRRNTKDVISTLIIHNDR